MMTAPCMGGPFVRGSWRPFPRQELPDDSYQACPSTTLACRKTLPSHRRSVDGVAVLEGHVSNIAYFWSLLQDAEHTKRWFEFKVDLTTRWFGCIRAGGVQRVVEHMILGVAAVFLLPVPSKLEFCSLDKAVARMWGLSGCGDNGGQNGGLQVGGMGDVVTALARAVQEEGHNVNVILPKFDVINYGEVRCSWYSPELLG